ncbi:hypothetical protein NDU88_002851 [Pleurodeles waltl]|uniref:Uncharacterized protein n=1 Tax=Pleurodeles waltl TaxID=8319 RepID=A0AAV7W3L5_PLEWA|nr:hypothetical protein NDU88_002851 [Pleurodeles waltl]
MRRSSAGRQGVSGSPWGRNALMHGPPETLCPSASFHSRAAQLCGDSQCGVTSLFAVVPRGKLEPVGWTGGTPLEPVS